MHEDQLVVSDDSIPIKSRRGTGVDVPPHLAPEVTSAFFPAIGRHMRRYAYILMFLRIYAYLRVSTCIYLCFCVSTRIYAYLHVYTCVSAYLRVSTRIYMYILVFLRIYACLRVYVIIFLRPDG